MLAVAIAVALFPIQQSAIDSVNRRLENADPTVCLSRFLNYPPSKGKLGFPRCLFEKPFPSNPNFWLKDIDLSCASPWNDSCGTQRAGTLISKRHVVFAKHFPLWSGARILFVDKGGEVCPCNVEKTKEVAGTDIMVGSLNAEVTPNIRPARILPDDFTKYIGCGRGMPLATLTRQEQAYLSELNEIPTNGAPPKVRNIAPKLKLWQSFRAGIVGGDSGNPAFLIIGDEAVLLYCLHMGGLGSGPWIHLHRREVQAAMDELCPGYKLETFNFQACAVTTSPDGRLGGAQ